MSLETEAEPVMPDSRGTPGERKSFGSEQYLEEKSRRRVQTKAEKTKYLATEETVAVAEKHARRKISAVSSTETTSLYLILPSYTEQFQAEIKEIIARVKSKLCNNSYFKKIFESVEFKIAFSNSRNLKKMIVI